MNYIFLRIKFFSILIVMMFCSLLTSCTTAIYGRGLVPTNGAQNEYSLNVYTGGFSGQETADARAYKEFKDFMTQNHYSSYKVIDRQQHFVPSYFEYTVRFYRNNETHNQ